MDNTWVFAFTVAILRRVGKLLGGKRGGDVFLQVGDEVWKWFLSKRDWYILPDNPDAYDFTDLSTKLDKLEKRN